MVLKKRIYYGGFHGLLAPVIPKAPRSSRKRISRHKSSDGGEICAFELLAAVAGKLLEESESSTSSIGSEKGVKHELPEVNVKPAGSEYHDQASGAESEVVVKPASIDLKIEPPLKEVPQSENDSGSDHASNITMSDFIKKDVTHFEGIEDKPEGGSPKPIRAEAVEQQSGGLTAVNNTYSLKDQVASRVNTCVPKSPPSSVHVPLYRDPVPSACYSRYRDNVNTNIRDDDEKYLRYSNRSYTSYNRRRVFGSRSRAESRRIRKMLTYKYWKTSPKLKYYELADTTNGVKSFDHKRKNIYMRERYQAYCASKRRKVFDPSPKSAYVKESSSESISNSVRFSIKSFKVPELYVEVPETATVGYLKGRVMKAVTEILQGQLHVGVLLQGKKVRDDNRTLQQTGISENCNLESLGFTLEPIKPEPSPTLVQKETPLLLPCNTQQDLSRSPSSPITDGEFSNSSPDNSHPVTTLDNYMEKNQGNTTFPAEVTTEEQVADSKALVLVPERDAEVLSMVPLSEKPPKRFEYSQRRTRRPFSVSEVEALVEAVETLGAGRWRDVKMRSFDDANHRTYVDLKDKWKTLVHTASIAPQQRRGEPVPQNLLDRVLAAHSYWSQHQSKQNMKQQKTLVAPM
ncbi:Homeodomain-like protein [Artemisia annua]|uniref:Homeodomain-like protein n=1 Tax=Artemisia annua TaxID=35608 RepID=A0A2U1P981_ARTAN|nr:Homeodomain-like protein [Artemisia annua]